MAIDFSKLRDQLAKNADAEASAKALIQKLLAEIEQIAKAADGPTQSALNDLTSQFAAQTDDLSAAVVEGTKADPGVIQDGQDSKPVDPNAPAANPQPGGSQ